LFQVNKVPEHFLRRELIEQAQHSLEQKAVLAAAQLLGDDDAGMGALGRLPRLVEGAKSRMLKVTMARFSPVAKASLFLIGSCVSAGFLGRQDIVAPAPQIDRQPGHDSNILG